MNTELKELAGLALRNAFWREFSALANKYLVAADGLDTIEQERMMNNVTSIYGRDDKVEEGLAVKIWTQDGPSIHARTVWSTIYDALEHKAATKLYLVDRKVFERRGNKWYFVGDEK